MKINLYPYLRFFRRAFSASLLMILFISNLGAQHWAESSSRWKYICFSALNGGAALCFDLQVSGQFVVDGVLCYKIDGGDRRLYTYESGDTAYIYLNGAFRPMYYFGARLGDTVLLYNDSTRFNRGPEYLHGIVDSIVTQNIFGQALKRFYVSIIDTLTYHTFYSISYAEKLGYTSNNGFVFYPSYENIFFVITVIVRFKIIGYILLIIVILILALKIPLQIFHCVFTPIPHQAIST
jgi:hypothetical protein